MNKLWLIVAALSMGSVARADIVDDGPTDDAQYTQIVLTGKGAAEFAEGLKAKWEQGAALRTFSSQEKVWMSSDELTQIFCVSKSPNAGHFGVPADAKKTVDCTIQQSTNGKKLKKHVIFRAVG